MAETLFLQEDKNMMKLIGMRIRKKRNIAGLTQEAVAELMDWSTTTISRLENGQQLTSILNLIRLASVLNTNVGDFFTDFNANHDITIKNENDEFRDLLKDYTPQQKQYLLKYMKWLSDNFPEFTPE